VENWLSVLLGCPGMLLSSGKFVFLSMRGHLFFTMLITVVFWGRLPAQSLDETNFTCYTRVQGLSNNSISGIVQDSTGYLWIATYKGLNRFDGRDFTNYFTGSADLPLPDNLIKRLSVQGKGGFIYFR
jgi:ligand-binding sensor domain-containing protein